MASNYPDGDLWFKEAAALAKELEETIENLEAEMAIEEIIELLESH